MNKKAIAILGAIFILIIATLGFLVYQKYSTKTTAAPAQTSTGQTSTTPPVSASTSTTPVAGNSGPLVKLTTSAIISPALFYNGSGITYFTPSGDLFQADLVNASGTVLQLNRQRNL